MSLFNYECDEVKRIIQAVRPNYPQLITYESEWIYFYENEYTPGTPVELEYEPVIINPTGSISNAIPFNYKSAILKGNTKYRDIDTGDILDTFDKTKNLELVSVKGPVLETIGENIIGECINPTEKNKRYKAYLKPNTDYTLSYKNTDGSSTGSGKVYLKNGDTEIASFGYKHQLNFTTPSTTSSETILCINSRVVDISVLLIEGKVPYNDLNLEAILKKPYKSNILTVNEEVELRGIGEVQDELNLLAGELTQRIGEVVLDGSENWSADIVEFTNTYRFHLKIDDIDNRPWEELIHNTPFVKSNTFRSLDLRTEAHNLDTEHLSGWDYSRIILNISKEKLSEFSVDALKTYIQKNPITLQYQLATESIKTFDLTPLNKPYEGVNHYHLTSNIPCESILEVPVVSTGEQTLQEINNY